MGILSEKERSDVISGLKSKDPMAVAIAIEEAALQKINAQPTWEPNFDAFWSSQEKLVHDFCTEIAGSKDKKGTPPDGVRLCEMAKSLYEAERDSMAREWPIKRQVIGWMHPKIEGLVAESPNVFGPQSRAVFADWPKPGWNSMGRLIDANIRANAEGLSAGSHSWAAFICQHMVATPVENGLTPEAGKTLAAG